MDPLALVLGALAAGAADLTGGAVTDAYRALKRLVAARLSGRGPAQLALAQYERDPRTWREPVAVGLRGSGALADPAVLEAAQRLMALVDADGARAGRFVVHLTGAQGVQIGDHNTQHNRFGA
ncbi:hypothetical protein [Dactylosporangium sp. NPDC049140]|uniref:hypothetical protein n=1 Tax=Dactylosporangium sp. NPDC049140 TaxID=3155647 RepID=UPI0033DC3F31